LAGNLLSRSSSIVCRPIIFLAVGFEDAYAELIKVFNDAKIKKTTTAWLQFFLVSIYLGAFWLGSYLMLKVSETKFLEVIFAKQTTKQ